MLSGYYHHSIYQCVWQQKHQLRVGINVNALQFYLVHIQVNTGSAAVSCSCRMKYYHDIDINSFWSPLLLENKQGASLSLICPSWNDLALLSCFSQLSVLNYPLNLGQNTFLPGPTIWCPLSLLKAGRLFITCIHPYS